MLSRLRDRWTARLRAFVHAPFFLRAHPLSAREAIGWWEARRVPFNLIVGATGIVTCLACLVLLAIVADFSAEPAEMPEPFLGILAIGAFAFLANVCFTGGWVVELIVRRLWDDDGTRFASVSFTLGLVLSVGITLAPAALMAGFTALRFLIAISGH